MTFYTFQAWQNVLFCACPVPGLHYELNIFNRKTESKTNTTGWKANWCLTTAITGSVFCVIVSRWEGNSCIELSWWFPQNKNIHFYDEEKCFQLDGMFEYMHHIWISFREYCQWRGKRWKMRLNITFKLRMYFHEPLFKLLFKN